MVDARCCFQIYSVGCLRKVLIIFPIIFGECVGSKDEGGSLWRVVSGLFGGGIYRIFEYRLGRSVGRVSCCGTRR